MKVAGIVIQDRNITKRTESDFEATYKGKNIIISTNHGFGKPKHDFLDRYNIEVTDIKTGMCDVQSYQDFPTLGDAIIFALKGACLIPK